MSSYHWIKLWHEIVYDPKMGRLPDNLWRRFIECCCLAGELDQAGRLPPIHDIAWKLHIEEETLRAEFDQLARMGLIDFTNTPLDEHWVVSSFAKRQERMSAAERMQRKRERDRKQGYYAPVTERNTDKIREEEDKKKKETIPPASSKLPPETYWTGPKLENFISSISGLTVYLGIDHQSNVKRALIERGDEDVTAALDAAFVGWCQTKSEKTGKPYSPHNLGWIDWGTEYLMTGTKRWEPEQMRSTADELEEAGYARSS